MASVKAKLKRVVEASRYLVALNGAGALSTASMFDSRHVYVAGLKLAGAAFLTAVVFGAMTWVAGTAALGHYPSKKELRTPSEATVASLRETATWNTRSLYSLTFSALACGFGIIVALVSAALVS